MLSLNQQRVRNEQPASSTRHTRNYDCLLFLMIRVCLYFIYFSPLIIFLVDYCRRLVGSRFDGYADIFIFRVDHSGEQYVARGFEPFDLHRSLVQSRSTDAVHNCSFSVAILFPVGRSHFHLRKDRYRDLGQKDARRSSSTSRSTIGSFQTKGNQIPAAIFLFLIFFFRLIGNLFSLDCLSLTCCVLEKIFFSLGKRWNRSEGAEGWGKGLAVAFILGLEPIYIQDAKQNFRINNGAALLYTVLERRAILSCLFVHLGGCCRVDW